jgi:hypothetical protein
MALAALIVFFWRLGTPYLWQDEAATAVLAGRMMRTGKPVAYDGRNLITMDVLLAGDREAIPHYASDAEAAVRYYVWKGDFPADTRWVGQPWGQFIAAGVSLAALGRSTFAARAPFAAASVLTVVLLFALARRVLRDRLAAVVAVVLLLLNPYWVLHGRQCRYYALSSLFLVLTVLAFARWRRGGSLGGALFVASAWAWFHCDFGAFWAGAGVLLVAAALAPRPGWRAAALAGGVLAGAVAPFVVYYRLLDRHKVAWESWDSRLFTQLFNVNQFVVPLVVLAAVGVMLVRRRNSVGPLEVSILAACAAVVAATPLWAATIGPWHYHRYVVQATPVASLLQAWGIAEAASWASRRRETRWLRPAAAWALAAFLALSPAASNAVSGAIPADRADLHGLGTLLRPELSFALETVLGTRPDPNREAIELVMARARPGDEVLVNYEDIPFMFYTDLAVRGGIPAFRVTDRSGPPPRFLVLRPNTHFVHWPVFEAEVRRARWLQFPTSTRSVFWGNNPDPTAQGHAPDLPIIIVAERLEEVASP